MISDFQLTSEQRAVVECDAAAVVVTAAAGTGKTEILARRAERFLKEPTHGYSRVLVITYTTRTAKELQSRLRDRVGDSMERVFAETIHGFAHKIISVHGGHIGLPLNFDVITKDEDRVDLLRHYDCHSPSEDYATLFRKMDLARAKCEIEPEIAPLLKCWKNAMMNSGALDFSEMIEKATEALTIPAIVGIFRTIYGLVIVDEAQNLTPQQYRFITTLVERAKNTSPVKPSTLLLGDPNQTVTGFAGGEGRLMSQFSDDYQAVKFNLTQNFRSSRLLASLERVLSKKLHNDRDRQNIAEELSAEGVIDNHECPSEEVEGLFVANWIDDLLEKGLPPEAVSSREQCHLRPEDIAVLARHSTSLARVSAVLIQRGHEVARSFSDDEFMASTLGVVAMLLMRLHSPRHQRAAYGALRRELDLPDLSMNSAAIDTDSDSISNNFRTMVSMGLQERIDDNFQVLVHLLCCDTPSEFVDTLKNCDLPKNARDELLTGWQADRQVIANAWHDYISVTPRVERSWYGFAQHIDFSQRGRDLGAGVRLLTVHKSQGREFRAVAVVGMNAGQFPDFRARSEEDRRAELQAFYVAATRASRMLLLTRACERPTRFGSRATKPSPYLRFISQAKAQ